MRHPFSWVAICIHIHCTIVYMQVPWQVMASTNLCKRFSSREELLSTTLPLRSTTLRRDCTQPQGAEGASRQIQLTCIISAHTLYEQSHAQSATEIRKKDMGNRIERSTMYVHVHTLHMYA